MVEKLNYILSDKSEYIIMVLHENKKGQLLPFLLLFPGKMHSV